jgi:hypothetical protein
MDYRRLTAPCGLPCFVCYLYLANDDPEIRAQVAQVMGLPLEEAVCPGCRPAGGKPHHLDMPCRLYPCAQARGVEFCSGCADFPCDLLHPYVDQAAKWHNAKVFNLCLIKKMGLESWARDKAESIRDTYFTGKWTL